MASHSWIRKSFIGKRGLFRSKWARIRPCLETMENRILLTTRYVYSPVDNDGQYSLRTALSYAKSGDTIEFSPLINYIDLNLNYGPLRIDTNLTIEAPPGHVVEISGGYRTRDLIVGGGVNLTLKGLDLTKGNGTDFRNPNFDNQGGAVFKRGHADDGSLQREI